MGIVPTYPGVYVREVSSGVRTISGVSTSVAAFVGYASRGPLDNAVQVLSYAQYEREFGGLLADSPMSYAVQQFFLNGGAEAVIIRTADGAIKASITLLHAVTAGEKVLVASARDEGAGGNLIRLEVDYETSNPAASFNLTVIAMRQQGADLVVDRSEVFRNLLMDSNASNYALAVVNAGSQLIRLSLGSGITNVTLAAGISVSKDLSGGLGLSIDDHTISISVDGNAPELLKLFETAVPGDLSALVASIETRLALIPSLNTVVEVSAAGDALVFTSKSTDSSSSVVIRSVASNDAAAKLGLGLEHGGVETPAAAALRPAITDGTINVSQYALGVGSVDKAQADPVVGSDGDPPGQGELLGSESAKTGLYALEDVSIFNLLAIPRMASITDPTNLLSAASAYCERRRAILLIDPPAEMDTVADAKTWIGAVAHTKNSASYFPNVMVPDPLNDFRPRSLPPSGTLAGLIARTDGQLGVWKAPGGTSANLVNVHSLKVSLSDREIGVLNPLALNCLRTLPSYGPVAWGARTMFGENVRGSEWKYLPVRRLALFIEESLYRGTQWVVFEPNDETLWSQIRLNVGTFMHGLFRQGAFQGSKPGEAYFVKCDADTTIQADIDQGIVNVLVGFAPVKPAEFVLISLQQMAGQSGL